MIARLLYVNVCFIYLHLYNNFFLFSKTFFLHFCGRNSVIYRCVCMFFDSFALIPWCVCVCNIVQFFSLSKNSIHFQLPLNFCYWFFSFMELYCIVQLFHFLFFHFLFHNFPLPLGAFISAFSFEMVCCCCCWIFACCFINV